MPTITKQDHRVVKSVARPSANGPSKAGSMLARGVPVAELEQIDLLSVLLYGVNRIGKTTLACQFEKPLALISCEPSPLSGGGAKSVARIAGVEQYLVIPSTAEAVWPKTNRRPIVGTAELEMLLAELMTDDFFRTIVIDGATSLQDVCLTEIMGLPVLPAQMKVAQFKGDTSYGVATGDQYRDRSGKAKEVLRKFLNLPKHRIVLAKEKDHNPPKDEKNGQVRRDKLTRGLTFESFVAADLGQATADWLMDACDCVCRMWMAKETKTVETNVGGTKIKSEQETGRLTRRLLTQYHPNFAAGIRSCDPNKVPEYIEDPTPHGMHQKLMRVLRGE